MASVNRSLSSVFPLQFSEGNRSSSVPFAVFLTHHLPKLHSPRGGRAGHIRRPVLSATPFCDPGTHGGNHEHHPPPLSRRPEVRLIQETGIHLRDAQLPHSQPVRQIGELCLFFFVSFSLSMSFSPRARMHPRTSTRWTSRVPPLEETTRHNVPQTSPKTSRKTPGRTLCLRTPLNPYSRTSQTL